MRQHANGLWSWTTALWSNHIEQMLKIATDKIRFSLETALNLVFESNQLGRWLYQHTNPNDWTAARLFASWIPMVFILTHHPWRAVVAICIIWPTDIIDGWMARKKGLSSAEGMKFETSVDTAFNLQTFIGVSIAYSDIRPILILAGILELVRLAGGIALRRFGYDGEPNRSGRAKTWAYAIGTNLRLIAPKNLAQVVLTIGVGLSVYSITMHLVRFLRERNQRH